MLCYVNNLNIPYNSIIYFFVKNIITKKKNFLFIFLLRPNN